MSKSFAINSLLRRSDQGALVFGIGAKNHAGNALIERATEGVSGLGSKVPFGYDRVMNTRTRKLIGTIIILVFLAIYALVVMVLSYPILKDAGKFAEFLFYLVAGLAWTLPAGVIIKWMAKPNAPKS